MPLPPRPSFAARARANCSISEARKRQAMIRAGPGHRRRRLHDVQPVHLAAQLLDLRILLELAALVKRLHVANMSGPAGQKVGIERQNHFSAFGAVDRVDVTPESKFSAFACAVADRRFPLMPFRLRILLQECLYLRGERPAT